MTTFNHSKFGKCSIKDVHGEVTTIITETGEEKKLLTSFVEKIVGKLESGIELKMTGNGYYEITFNGKKIHGREVVRSGFKKYESDHYVNHTDFSEKQTRMLIKNSHPQKPSSINF